LWRCARSSRSPGTAEHTPAAICHLAGSAKSRVGFGRKREPRQRAHHVGAWLVMSGHALSSSFWPDNALQPVFGVRFDPRAERHHGNTSRCAMAGRWEFATTQHLVNRRAAIAEQACRFDDIDLQWFNLWCGVLSLGWGVSLILVSFVVE
jgi:hypothetical protein